jgi:hypothetical protein
MKIEVSNGEILDKHTILKIKLEKIQDPTKRVNIQKEWDTLTPCVDRIMSDSENEAAVSQAYQDLLEVNRTLWKIEDEIRDCERAQDFGSEFIRLARAVYYTNDDRNLVKKKIDSLSGSTLTEEKSYQDYKNK